MNELVDINEEAAHKKLIRLQAYLKELGNIAVAFSGGVDSAFLLKAAHDCLGDRVIAITASSQLFPDRELEEAKAFCEKEGIRQYIFEFDAFAVEGFVENPPNRCYLCKRALFEKMQEISAKQGIQILAEGSNMEDNGDYRPGLAAIAQLEVKSPLRHVKLYKTEIRQLSKKMGLPTWKKQSFACLASRFVYGEPVTKEKLDMPDRAEQLLLERGFRQFRVRMHGKLARIEIMPEEFEKLIEKATREEIVSKLKSYGFNYVSMDLSGYRTGSMNETIG